MGPPQRIRYNTKARGGKSHKKRGLFKKPKKNTLDASNDGPQVFTEDVDHQSREEVDKECLNTMELGDMDPGFEVVVPKTVAQKEQDRKECLMREVGTSHYPRAVMSISLRNSSRR